MPVLESRHWSFSEKSPKSLTGYHGMPSPPEVRAKPPSSVIQLSPPGPACSHFSRSAAELRIVSSSTYGCHSPPSTRISVARTPDPSPSVASRSTSTGPS